MAETNEIGDAFAAALQRMLKERKLKEPKLTIDVVAKELGVTRQTFHSYLQGNLPRRKRLNKAVHRWDLKLDLGEYSFGKEAFGPEQRKGNALPKPSQLKLLELLDSVRKEDLRVEMKRVGKVLHVDVKIQIPA